MNSTIGTGQLVRLALRLDRVRLPVWILAVCVLATSFASSIDQLYPTEAARQGIAGGIGRNATMLALYGPVFDTSVGGVVAWRLGIIGAVLVALMSIQTVNRHTRADEETGRLELVGATVVGRRAPLAAALVVAAAANAVLALVVGVGLASQGVPLGGALVTGCALGALGLVFTGVTAVAVQLTENARTVTGMAVGVFGVAFLLRAVGDAAGPDGPRWLSWLSPIGWMQQTRPFAGDRWAVVALMLGVAAVLVAVAHVLVGRRDFGLGMIPPRPGPAEATGLGSPLALAWRLHRGSLIGWAVGFAVAGAAFGGVLDSAADLVKDSPQAMEIFERMGGAGALVDSFLAAIVGLVGLVAAVYAVQATLRLRSEETSLRAEPLLATAVGRLRWAASHLVFAFLGAAGMLAAAGLATGLVYGAQTGDVGGQIGNALRGALAQLPAVLVVAGIALALFGLAPRLVVLSWALLTGFLLLGQLGPVLQLPRWAMNVSPFTHVPTPPLAEVTAQPLLWLGAVVVVLSAAGLAGFRRRDIG